MVRGIDTAKEKKEEVLHSLKDLGKKVYDDLELERFPTLRIPSRSVRNIRYNEAERAYLLGEKALTRTAANITHLRPMTQFTWVAYFARELLKEGRTSTLRDVYYSSQAFGVPFKDQKESDDSITDMEAVFSRPREEFNIVPEERASIFGDLTIEYTVPGYEGKRVNLTYHPDGVMIGHALRTAELVESSAKRVFVIEKGAIFTRFVEEDVPSKYKAILISTVGQAPRAARYLIRRLNQELGLPIYILTDGDPWGLHVSGVIIYGSANAAHISGLTTPEAQWIGVWATDLVRYDLPSEKLTDRDLKRLRELLRDPRYGGKFWKREIKKFLEIKKKAELEAFSRYGLTFIVDKYLKEKMKAVSSSKPRKKSK
ncbi:MAG: DNA topoisomerase IV subunit A [Nitrososphaeria archaeon]|nr:DNA topoisomerase IV subunit A [Nitrososphaeria archaeon]NIQ33367.1 DNA topoisomerase IV subunit A [Nitrososphaeria archaeon]